MYWPRAMEPAVQTQCKNLLPSTFGSITLTKNVKFIVTDQTI